MKRSDWWRLKRLVSASVASVCEICGSGAWVQHTLLDDRDMLLSGGHLLQSVCEQYFGVCGRRTVSAVRVSFRRVDVVDQIVLFECAARVESWPR